MTFFDWVTLTAGFVSAKFWGRYLDHKVGVREGLTPEEADWLHSKGCKILPIYAGITPTTLATGFGGGVADANAAIAHALALGVPSGTVLYGDIERDYMLTYDPTHVDWVRGWAQTMWESQYGAAGGFYGNTIPNNHFRNVYCDAYAGAPAIVKFTYIGAAGVLSPPPGGYCGPAGQAPAWDPAIPPCLAQNVIARQYGPQCYLHPNSPGNAWEADLNLAESFAFARMW